MSISDHVQYLDIKLNAIDENIIDLKYISQTLKLYNVIPVGALPMLPGVGSPVPMAVDEPVNPQFMAKVASGTYEALSDLFAEVKIKGVKIEEGTNSIRVIPITEYSGDLR